MIDAAPYAAVAPTGGLRPNAFLDALPRGRLVENVMHFVRILRAAGLPVGPAKVLDALAAVEAIGVSHRDDFRAALAAVLVSRREHQPVFEQAFALFWRNPRLLERMLAALLPKVEGRARAPDELPARARRQCCRRLRVSVKRATRKPISTPHSRSRRAKCCSTRTSRR
jgi:uncharacterized protein with von Willebrand factor type A (vWA) domain